MTRDTGRRHRGAAAAASDAKGRRHACSPTVQPLEDRQLLSQFFSGISANRPVQAPGGMYMLSISGPGFERVKQLGHGQIAVTLLGTTDASTLSVSLTRPRLHKPATPLQIASIKVNSGQLGGINAPGAVLNGAITPILGAVNTLDLGALGPNAQIDVGSVGSLSISGAVTLGAGGHVNIGGVSSGLTLGGVTLDGGRFVVSGDVDGGLNLGAVDLTQGGQFLIGHDVTGTAQVAGDLDVNTHSLFSIGHDVTGAFTVDQDVNLDSGGQVAVGNDMTGLFHVGGDLNISNGARLIVNRDLTGGMTVDGDLDLASGGALTVGRTLSALTVHGNLSIAPTGSEIAVGGDLTNLTVDGAFTGQGSSTAIDLQVGLNLGQLTVSGGGAGLGGLRNANINVDKSILGLNIVHGIFNSLITAGVTITGGTPPSSGNNIGADGTDAILNSQLLASVSIVNLEIGGDVVSTFAVNPNSTGYPTRIIAGETPAATYAQGGLSDNFQTTGTLNDSVLAASVAPSGGDGTLPLNGYNVPAPPTPPPGGTYDAPAGMIAGGTVGTPIEYPNWTELNYFNETLTPPYPPGKTFYNTTIDPTIDDLILLGGAINPSFASPPLSEATLTNTTTTTTNSASATTGTTSTTSGSSSITTVTPNEQPLPLPTKSTVLGGVISTQHGDSADFAGIFAFNTSGVFVGAIPSSS